MTIARITPAIQRVRFARHPVNYSGVARKAHALIPAHPMVVLSGTNQTFFDNCQIGKTQSTHAIFQEQLRRGVASEYRDIKGILRMDNRPTSRIDVENFNYEMIDTLPAVEFYILDEFHHAFPRDPQVKGKKGPWGIKVYRGEDYNDTMFAFWRKMEGLRQDGARFLLVTALHPQQAEYRDFQHDTAIPMMAEYFSSPVMELQSF
jgi:hypothetical protein